jgi:hypothetical protein
MHDTASILGSIGFLIAVGCLGAYVWAYILKVRAFRPLSVVALICTVLAMAQLALWLNGYGTRLNGVYAMIFLIVSGLAQSYNALSGRAGRPDEKRGEPKDE